MSISTIITRKFNRNYLLVLTQSDVSWWAMTKVESGLVQARQETLASFLWPHVYFFLSFIGVGGELPKWCSGYSTSDPAKCQEK